jgi:hypothetical protein
MFFIPGFIALGPTPVLSVKEMNAYTFVLESSMYSERVLVFER